MCIHQSIPQVNTDFTSRKRCRSPTSVVDYEEPCCSESNKRRRVVKAVRFAPTIMVSACAVSSPDTWYNVNDYTAFKKNMKRDVYYLASLCRAKTCQQMDTNEYSPLGLEKYCCSSSEQKQSKATKQQRITAVLEQQKLQKQMGYHNDEAIRLMGHVLSQQAVQKAIARAERLAKA